MLLWDRLLDRLKREDAQKKLRESLLDPAADYLARKLFKFVVFVGFVMLLQTCLILVLVLQLDVPALLRFSARRPG